MRRAKSLGEHGFTLVELVIVTVVLVSASLFSIFFLLNPINRDEENNNAERRSEIAYIAQGIQRYVTDTGQLPPDIPSEAKAIGSYEDHYNLCTSLVPKYMKDMPLDPGGGVKLAENTAAGTTCSDKGVRFATGYAISKDRANRVIISAPFSETDEQVAISIVIEPLAKK
jgi:prepilin-type N-terminal cleavage/methylation domain-containing protein